MNPTTILRRAALPLTLLACLPAVSAAQTTQARLGRVSSVLAQPVSGAALAQATGLTLTGEVPGIAVSLEQPPTMRPEVFQRIIDILDASPITLFAEEDARIELPEFEGCALGGQVGVQQCTVGFVSGDPGLDCELKTWIGKLGLGPVIQGAKTATPVVAVLDSGVDASVPLLSSTLFSPGYDHVLDKPGGYDVPDGLDQDGDGLVDEAFGHGTHVASTIVSLAPDALILPIRVVDADGIGWGFDVAEGLLTAIQAGPDTINLSLSMAAPSKFVSILLALAMANGIEVVAAVGNTASEGVLFPASFVEDPTGTFAVPASMPHGVIAVAALDIDQIKADFSAYGAEVDVCGLGVRVCGKVPGDETQSWNGTSMATAVISGTMALVRSRAPTSYVGPMGELLVQTASPVDGLNPEFAGMLGTGAFDVFAALGAAEAAAE